jgi:[acyl-carrier-protein] S-malonyltransferase
MSSAATVPYPPAGGGTAIVFPGMAASSYADIGRFMVLDRYVRPRVRAADLALGESLLAGFRAEAQDFGPFAQVAFLVNSLALADRAAAELGMVPDVCVGPSFGQRAATVYTGALSFAEAVCLTVELARCEADYFASLPEDLVTQCFVRVPPEVVSSLLDSLSARGEWIELSVELGDGGVMLSMPSRLLDEVAGRVRDAGGYVMQTMRPAVHARRFAPLRSQADAILDCYPVTDPSLPIVADQDGRMIHTAADLRAMLLDTFDHPVNWPAAVASVVAAGASTAYVTGPDQLFHKLGVTKSAFHVVPVTPKVSFRPVH